MCLAIWTPYRVTFSGTNKLSIFHLTSKLIAYILKRRKNYIGDGYFHIVFELENFEDFDLGVGQPLFTGPQRCPSGNFWRWIPSSALISACHVRLHSPEMITWTPLWSSVELPHIKVRWLYNKVTLEWEDYAGLSGWAQCNQKDSWVKQEEGRKTRVRMIQHLKKKSTGPCWF